MALHQQTHLNKHATFMRGWTGRLAASHSIVGTRVWLCLQTACTCGSL